MEFAERSASAQERSEPGRTVSTHRSGVRL